MSDSGSFTSLLSLVDNHLSKTNTETSKYDDDKNPLPRLQLPSLTVRPNETASEPRLGSSSSRFPWPTFHISSGPIQEVLAKQVSNMLKAKERKKKREEERTRQARDRQQLEDYMRNLNMDDDSDCVIDLVKAVNESTHFKRPDPSMLSEFPSTSSSSEVLVDPNIINSDNESEIEVTTEPPLPCNTDMSYILVEKIHEGRCSAFGKILSARLRPATAPYFREKVNTNIVRFDFNTKSPCDLTKEKLHQPPPTGDRKFDLFSIFPDLEVQEDCES